MTPAEAAPSLPRPRAAVVRWALPAALLTAEFLALSVLVDLPAIDSALPLVRAIRIGLPVIIGAAAASWLMARAGGGSSPRAPGTSPLPAWRPLPALAAQPLAYLATALLAVRLFGPGSAPPGLGWLAAFLGCALATAFLAAATAAPLPWLGRELVRRWRAPLLAVALGLAAWRAAMGAEELWGALSSFTLHASGTLLRLVAGDVVVDPVGVVIGLGGFEVQVAPVCSGADGLGLVLTFQLLWIALSRRRLRVGRALLLVPVGLAAALAANVGRIAGLVLLGAAGHEDLALGGFHSKAGWVLFLTIALGSVATAERLRWLRAPGADVPVEVAGRGIDRADPVALVPLVLTMVVALLTGVWTAGALDRLYVLRIAAALMALAWVHRALPSLAPSRSFLPAAVGLAVGAAWIAALRGAPQQLGAELAALGGLERVAWVGARVLGSVLVIPVVEELAFRGFLFEWLAPAGAAPGRGWSQGQWLALLVSSLAFGVVHQSFVLGALAGVAFGALRVWRGRLGDAVAAHAAANAVVAVAAAVGGRWELWS